MDINLARAFGKWKRRKAAYLATFGSTEGALVLKDLYAFAGIDAECYVPEDPQGTFYRLGMRRVALRIRSILGETETEFLARAGARSLNDD